MGKTVITICSYLPLRSQVTRGAKLIDPNWSLDSLKSPATVDCLGSTL